ncbi:MAG: hypothetical protein H7843_06590 [Nitrospirota bacterium]
MTSKEINRIILTIDIDWAPDFIIEEVATILISHNVKATWFVTHASSAIERLRQYPELFELGIHPNFYPGSIHGTNEDEVMKFVKEIVPDAISMRTHGLYHNANLLIKAHNHYGIEVDLSIFLPYTTNITPHRYRYGNLNKQLLRIPYFWEDDFDFYNPYPLWDINDDRLKTAGLKIINFHPIHIALNSNSCHAYESLKSSTAVSNCTPDDIGRFRNHGEGTATLFMQIVGAITGSGKMVKEFLE